MTYNEQEKRQIIERNDAAYDGQFYYGVKSTGIFCRPSCKSRPPRPENLVFFDTSAEAMAAGFRPCKRCRPDLEDYAPEQAMAEQIKLAIDQNYSSKLQLSQELVKLGLSQHRMRAVFKAQYGTTPSAYADRLRIQTAKQMLRNSQASVLDIALLLEFDSVSAFYAFFRKHTQQAPGEYRKNGGREPLPKNRFSQSFAADIGQFTIVADEAAITAVLFGTPDNAEGERPNDVTRAAARQLEEYAAGARTQFELPLAPGGTAFQQQVWQALMEIPYGQTRSYKQIAAQVGNPAASRAVGMANNKNPIPIIIPCHRVVGANGDLVGYAGGVEMKRRLLALELTPSGRR